jgi:O-methyltransferase
LQGIFPEETGHRVSETQFSRCLIDVDAYHSGRDVLEWVWPRLSVGGVVLFDDYGFPITKGIPQLVNAENAGRVES